jgi:hypothetical protein
MKKIIVCHMFFGLVTLPLQAAPGDLAQSFTLEGQLYDQPTGTTPFLGAAGLEIRILSHDKLCILYAESHSVDTTLNEGVFNIEVGSGSRVGGVDSSNTMARVFQNSFGIPAKGGSCPGGATYTPSVGKEERYLQIRVTPVATGITDVLSPEIFLGSVPTSLVSQTLQGYLPSAFLRLATVTELTQVNLENVFSDTNYPILQSLLTSGPSSSSSATNATINADNDGNGSGSILFQVGGATKAEVKNDGDFAVGSNSFYVDAATDRVGIANTNPSFDLSFGGMADKVLGMERNTSASPGSNMTIKSGGATASGANLDGGDLILSSGISTGLGVSNIYFKTSSAGGAGTSDNTPSSKLSILGNGNIGIGVLSPSAILEVTSTTSGIIIPRMTTAQRDAIASPSAMQIYNTTTNKLNFHNGSSWQELGVTGSGVTSIVAGTGLTGGTITSTGTIAVDVGNTAGKIPQLDGSGRLPAVDGSLLTNISAANLGTTVPVSKGGTALTAVGAANTILGTNSAGTAMEYKVASATSPISITNGANSISFDLATVPVTKGGTGLSALTGNRVYTSNALGTAFQTFTCSLTQVLSFNALGEPICSSLSVVSGGNSLGAAMTLGTNDAFDLNFETNNSTRMTMTSTGNLGVGTTAPNERFEVTGNIRVGSQTTRATSTNRGQLALGSTYVQTTNINATVDWNNGNIQEISTFACNGAKTITMTNAKDGVAYTLLLSGSAAHSGTCSFLGTGLTFKTSGGATPPIASRDVVFTFAVIGGTVVYSMLDNLL